MAMFITIREPAANTKTRTQKSMTEKRTRASPVKITANKLFADEDTRGDDDECADSTAAAEPRPLLFTVKWKITNQQKKVTMVRQTFSFIYLLQSSWYIWIGTLSYQL